MTIQTDAVVKFAHAYFETLVKIELKSGVFANIDYIPFTEEFEARVGNSIGFKREDIASALSAANAKFYFRVETDRLNHFSERLDEINEVFDNAKKKRDYKPISGIYATDRDTEISLDFFIKSIEKSNLYNLSYSHDK